MEHEIEYSEDYIEGLMYGRGQVFECGMERCLVVVEEVILGKHDVTCMCRVCRLFRAHGWTVAEMVIKEDGSTIEIPSAFLAWDDDESEEA